MIILITGSATLKYSFVVSLLDYTQETIMLVCSLDKEYFVLVFLYITASARDPVGHLFIEPPTIFKHFISNRLFYIHYMIDWLIDWFFFTEIYLFFFPRNPGNCGGGIDLLTPSLLSILVIISLPLTACSKSSWCWDWDMQVDKRLNYWQKITGSFRWKNVWILQSNWWCTARLSPGSHSLLTYTNDLELGLTASVSNFVDDTKHRKWSNIGD